MTAARYAVVWLCGLLTGAAACVGVALYAARKDGRI